MYKWNPKPILVRHVRGTKRIFHSEFSRCLRTKKAVTGDQPPERYWPCYICFPWGTKRTAAALDAAAKTKENK